MLTGKVECVTIEIYLSYVLFVLKFISQLTVFIELMVIEFGCFIQGIVRALREYQQKLIDGNVSIFVRRAGPNYQEGLRVMRELGETLAVYISLLCYVVCMSTQTDFHQISDFACMLHIYWMII